MSSSSSSSSSSSILTSLRYYDQIRSKSTNVIREEGSSVDLFTHETDEILLCHISGIIPFTFGDYIPWLQAYEDAATIAMAIQHLNTGDGSIVPEVEGLSNRCPVRFTVEFADTEFQGGVALGHVVDQAKRDPSSSSNNNGSEEEEGRIPCAFLGAYRSAISIPMGIVTGVFGIPQISAASTSADLDDTSQYPLFGRTIPSDAGNAIPFIQFLYTTLKIKHLAVININDAYGNAFTETLRKAAEEYAPDMTLLQVPVNEDSSSIQAAISTVKNTEYRFIFCLVFGNPHHDAIMKEAYQQGIAGTGIHNWIFGDSFLGTLDGRTFEKDSDLHLAYRGVGSLEVTGGVVGGVPKYDTFRSKISELHNNDDLEYLGSLFPKHDHPDYSPTPGEPPFINDDTFLQNPTSGFAPFNYEAVIALGLAACSASSEQRAFTGQNHFDHFVTTEFTSFSGKVEFDPTTGTRLPTSALYKVTNFIDTKIETMEENGDTIEEIKFRPVITNLFRNSEWTVLDNYIFNDGTTNLPSDLPPPIILQEDELDLPLLIGVPIGIVFLLGLVIFLFYEHTRKQNDSVWNVKKDELTFPDPPHIIGQGSFGVVLLAEYRGTQVAVKHVIPGKGGGEQDGTATSATAAMATNLGGDNSESNRGGGGGGGDPLSVTGHSSGMSLGMTSIGTKMNTTGVGMISGSMYIFQRGIPGKQSDSALRKRLKQEFIEEMRYLSKLRHPCVTTVMGAVIDRGEEPMLIMEYMDHGSLYDLLHNETMFLEGETLLQILRDISQGMRFLHSAVPQVLHGDLKAQNILVDKRFRAKVADFGLSQKQNLGGTGTPFWMAPELLRGESTNTAATDNYSFGIILYEVYSRKDPYEGEEALEVLKLVADPSMKKRPPVPRHMPAQLEALMAECLQDDPEQRASFEEVDTRLKRIDAETANPGGKSNVNISLFDIFPRHIAETLQAGRTVEPEQRDCVTIFFSDIVGFTDISSTLDPRKVSNMLDRLYTKFDALSEQHDIFKVETIGDAYMAVANLIKDQPDDHCKRIAKFAIDAIREANATQVDMDDPTKGFVNIRVGFHSGSVVADVVGKVNPRYCLFGDTVNTSSRMESNSKVNRIHCSQSAARILRKQAPEIPCRSRGVIPIKGKGEMKTYWVNDFTYEPPSTIKTINMLGEVESKEQPIMPSVRDRASFMMVPLAEAGDERSSAFFTPSTNNDFTVSTSSLPPPE